MEYFQLFIEVPHNKEEEKEEEGEEEKEEKKR